MKRLCYLLAIGIGLIALNSCDKATADNLDKDVPFTLTSPDGVTRTILSKSEEGSEALAFDEAFYMYPSDIDGCAWALAHTNGKMANDFFWLSMYLKDSSLKAGKEPVFERLSFGLPYSSNSFDYTGSFTGHIYVKEYSSKQLVLRYDHVVFEIAAGTYTLNGDLIYTSDYPEYLKEK